MPKEKDISGGHQWPRNCDSCREAASEVYCRDDLAYLCGECDFQVHGANGEAVYHERVSLCEVCHLSPASFTCKADAAALCTTCDIEVHSANPLARRHHRIPIIPISRKTSETLQINHRGLEENETNMESDYQEEEEEEEDDDEPASWLLMNPVKNHNQNFDFFNGDDVNDYPDLGDFTNPCTENQNYYKKIQKKHGKNQNDQEEDDRVVPVQLVEAEENRHIQHHKDHRTEFTHATSLGQSLSLSSMEARIVPDPSMVDISVSVSRTPKGTIDLFSGPPLLIPSQFNPHDREARVLRYREKRKTRKFEKTIRYASRKAYAEIRPRIKGRFAKRTTDADAKIDQMFLITSKPSNGGYGVVPTFQLV